MVDFLRVKILLGNVVILYREIPITFNKFFQKLLRESNFFYFKDTRRSKTKQVYIFKIYSRLFKGWPSITFRIKIKFQRILQYQASSRSPKKRDPFQCLFSFVIYRKGFSTFLHIFVEIYTFLCWQKSERK